MAGDKQPSLMTPVGICSFPNLAKPRQQTAKDKGKKPKYSTIIAWTPALLKREYTLKDGSVVTGKDLLRALMKSAMECLEAKHPGKAKAMVESGKLNWPFRSMEDEDEDSSHNFPDGTVWIQPATTGKPGVVDRYGDANGDPVEIDDDEIEEKVYAGCLIRATVRAYYYETDGNKGVSFSLNNVQKAGEGERLDGRKKANKEFDALEDGPDDVDEPPRKAKKAAPRRARDDDEDEDDAPPPRRKRAAPADDDEETTVPRTKKRAAPVEEEDDEEDDAPVRRKAAKRGRSLDDTL